MPIVALNLVAFTFASALWLNIPFGINIFLPVDESISKIHGLFASSTSFKLFANGFILHLFYLGTDTSSALLFNFYYN